MEMDWSHSPQGNRQHYMTSLNLESKGGKKRGRPRDTWHRDLEADVKETGYTSIQLEKLAQVRSARRSHVDSLCPRRGDEGFD